MTSDCPSAPGLPPNTRCQYSWLSTTEGALPGASSSGVKIRPSAGRMPSKGSVPSVTRSVSTRSGSPCPVTEAASSRHMPMSWKTRSSRYVRYVAGDMFRSPAITPGAKCHTATSCSGLANGSGFSSTPLTTLKMRALAPIATPSVTRAVRLKTGLVSRRRMACFT